MYVYSIMCRQFRFVATNHKKFCIMAPPTRHFTSVQYDLDDLDLRCCGSEHQKLHPHLMAKHHGLRFGFSQKRSNNIGNLPFFAGDILIPYIYIIAINVVSPITIPDIAIHGKDHPARWQPRFTTSIALMVIHSSCIIVG